MDPLFALFAQANEAIWPLQICWYAAAVVAVGLAIRPIGASGRLISGFLAAYYVWVGIVFFWAFHTRINDHAAYYGAMFVLAGVLWLVAAVGRSDLGFQPRWNATCVVGGLFMLYALVLYPILGMLNGHVFPAAPVFGIAPCPSTTFAFGLLLWVRGRVPRHLLIVPLVWALIAYPGALRVGVVEDLGMLVAAVVGTGLIVWRDRASSTQAVSAAVVLTLMVLESGHDDILMTVGLVLLAVTLVQEFAHGSVRAVPSGLASRLPQRELVSPRGEKP